MITVLVRWQNVNTATPPMTIWVAKTTSWTEMNMNREKVTGLVTTQKKSSGKTRIGWQINEQCMQIFATLRATNHGCKNNCDIPWQYWFWESRRFRNFCFYPSITPTGLVRAEDSLETEAQFKEKRRKEKDHKKKGENWRKKKEQQEANWTRLKKFSRENWRKWFEVGFTRPKMVFRDL